MKQETPAALRFLEDAIADKQRRALFRERPTYPPPGSMLNFCSNDYLGLADRPAPGRPSGSGSSRLVAGERVDHIELERAAAELVEQPEALVFTSGYAANIGVLSALAGPSDLIVSDALNHASLVDGARLSRARLVVVPHVDLRAIERALSGRRSGRAFVVTESYFSMDADGPDLVALRALCDAHNAALVVDEAHALGVLGPEGRGLCASEGVRADVISGTFGKAFGAAGAFVAGCPALVTWLWNRARSFVFSTGLSPAVAAAALGGIRVARAEPERRGRVLAAARQLRDGLLGVGVQPLGFGHVIPWVLGDATSALNAAAALRSAGIDVRAIRPPSVPDGTARLRFAATATHCGSDIERVVEAVSTLTRRGLP